MFEKIFKLRERGTNVSTRIIAGITTFMAMAYIILVNPVIPREPSAAATILTALFGTILSGFYTDRPFANSELTKGRSKGDISQ